MSKIIDWFQGNLRFVLLIAILLFVGSVYVWWGSIYQDPRNTFNRMINNSFSTYSFSKINEKTDQGQDLELTTVNQTSPSHISKTRSVLTDENDGTKIVTENIATVKNNYVRYTEIITNQKKQSGEDFDFSTVVNEWGLANASERDNSTVQIYLQNVIVPLARLDKSDREEMIKFIHDESVYEVDYSNVEQSSQNGRPVYIYDVEIKASSYLKMMKKLASSLEMSQLDDVNPDDYKDVLSLNFKFTVDVYSGNLKQITFLDENNRVENYGSYGLISNLILPDATITVDELQKRLSDLQ